MGKSVFVEDDQCGDDARHPSCHGEQKYNKHRSTTSVDDGERREEDGEEDAKDGHDGLFFEGFQCAAELVGAGGGFAAAADAVEFRDDFVDFLANDQTADALEVSVAAAHEENLLNDIIVVNSHIDKLRAGALGFVEGVGHNEEFVI